VVPKDQDTTYGSSGSIGGAVEVDNDIDAIIRRAKAVA
jgi:hypothetical protein